MLCGAESKKNFERPKKTNQSQNKIKGDLNCSQKQKEITKKSNVGGVTSKNAQHQKIKNDDITKNREGRPLPPPQMAARRLGERQRHFNSDGSW
jgi:hypothetical protein